MFQQLFVPVKCIIVTALLERCLRASCENSVMARALPFDRIHGGSGDWIDRCFGFFNIR